VIAVRGGVARRRRDRLAGEEPMEIRAGGPGQEAAPVAVTMRTPGNDFELAVGFLLTEGLLAADGVAEVRYCGLDDAEEQLFNVVSVRTREAFDAGLSRRATPATAACGVCGKASLDAVEVRCDPVPPGFRVAASTLLGLPDALRAGQEVFDRTGGLHAAGLFDAGGDLIALREDVGRHNAVDKLVGRALLAGELPLSDRVLMLSGRAGFELVQKAAVAGIPIVCAVSAPSSLAVEAAERLGLTLVGFLRGDGFNVYAGEERIDLSG
jgi:FdhD protein